MGDASVGRLRRYSNCELSRNCPQSKAWEDPVAVVGDDVELVGVTAVLVNILDSRETPIRRAIKPATTVTMTADRETACLRFKIIIAGPGTKAKPAF